MINPKIATVKAADDYQLVLTFTNAEQKVFYMKPYLTKGVFKALQDETLFKKAYVNWGTVVWNDDLDMSPDTLYLDSKFVEKLPTLPS